MLTPRENLQEVMKGGKPVARTMGAQPKAAIEKFLKDAGAL